MDRGAWWAIVHGFARVRHNLVTKPPKCVCVCVCVGGAGKAKQCTTVSTIF